MWPSTWRGTKKEAATKKRKEKKEEEQRESPRKCRNKREILLLLLLLLLLLVLAGVCLTVRCSTPRRLPTGGRNGGTACATCVQRRRKWLDAPWWWPRKQSRWDRLVRAQIVIVGVATSCCCAMLDQWWRLEATDLSRIERGRKRQKRTKDDKRRQRGQMTKTGSMLGGSIVFAT